MPALLRRIAQVPTSVSITHADSPFDKFGPLKKVPIRTPPKKERLEKLRELRDSLKSGNLTSEQILNRMKFYKNLTMFEAIALAEKEGSLLVPNSLLAKLFKESPFQLSTTFTGTLIIYQHQTNPYFYSPPLGDYIEYEVFTESGDTLYTLAFQVPEEFRLRINCALVVEYPDFALIDKGKLHYEVKLTEGADLHLVKEFPDVYREGSRTRCFLNNLGIPSGRGASEFVARHWDHLSSVCDTARAASCYIGLVGHSFDPSSQQWLIANSKPCDKLVRVAFIG